MQCKSTIVCSRYELCQFELENVEQSVQWENSLETGHPSQQNFVLGFQVPQSGDPAETVVYKKCHNYDRLTGLVDFQGR